MCTPQHGFEFLRSSFDGSVLLAVTNASLCGHWPLAGRERFFVSTLGSTLSSKVCTYVYMYGMVSYPGYAHENIMNGITFYFTAQTVCRSEGHFILNLLATRQRASSSSWWHHTCAIKRILYGPKDSIILDHVFSF